MFKNLTISQITTYITTLITFCNALIFFVLFTIFVRPFPFIWYLIAIIISFIASYFFVSFLLEQFVFRKIKLIYKIIHDSKLNPERAKENVNLKDAALEIVNDEVVAWAEETRQELSSLKNLEEYRKNFVGNISHELKTPLFSIQGYLHTLLDGGLKDNKINKKYLKRAASNTERLQTIVEDLEIISKLESDSAVLDMMEFDIKALTEEVIMDLEFQAKKRDIDMVFKEGADNAFQVVADRESIRRVLTNLISNSIKYGKEGGITKISFYDMNERILIEISDDGIGIEDQSLIHVFDRFYRVDSSRSRAMGGSGLGLSIVKHIIEAHQQNINVRSTPHVGSTFGFTLQKKNI